MFNQEELTRLEWSLQCKINDLKSIDKDIKESFIGAITKANMDLLVKVQTLLNESES